MVINHTGKKSVNSEKKSVNSEKKSAPKFTPKFTPKSAPKFAPKFAAKNNHSKIYTTGKKIHFFKLEKIRNYFVRGFGDK